MRRHARAWLAAGRAWLLGRVVQSRVAPVRQLLMGLAASLLGLAVGWAVQGPALHEQLLASQQRLAQDGARLEALRRQRDAATVPPKRPADAQAQGASSWPWHRQALAAGLMPEQVQAVSREPGGASAGQLRLRLRGAYHQHGDWLARMAGEPALPRLLSYQLLPAEAGALVAEVLIEPGPVEPRLALPPLARAYRPASLTDPLADPVPPDGPAPPRVRVDVAQAGVRLEGAGLAELSLVGTLHRDGQWVAWLGWQRWIYSVGEGDHLTSPARRVQRIDAHGLWLQEAMAQGAQRVRYWRIGQPGALP